jgi:hypothetical protein
MDNPEIVLVAAPATVKTALPVTTLPSGLPEAMAVMAVVPALTPVTSPFKALVQGAGEPVVQTVATAGLLEYQATV